MGRKQIVCRLGRLRRKGPVVGMGCAVPAVAGYLSALRTEARPVTLHEAELSATISSSPTRCLFGLAFPQHEQGSRAQNSSWGAMTGGNAEGSIVQHTTTEVSPVQ